MNDSLSPLQSLEGQLRQLLVNIRCPEQCQKIFTQQITLSITAYKPDKDILLVKNI
jgi:hypothetical protein